MYLNIHKSILLTAILMFLWPPMNVSAQSHNPVNELSLRYGISNGVIKDQLFSPLNYKTSGGSIGINYRRTTRKNNFVLAQAEIRTYELTTEISPAFRADQLQMNLEIAFLKQLTSNHAPGGRWFLGFDVHSNGNLIVWEDDVTLSSSGTYVSHRGLGLQAMYENQLFNNKLTLYAKLPLIGKAYRSPYNVFDKTLDDDALFSYLYTYGEFGSIHNYLNPTLSANYSIPVFKKLTFTAGYELNYLKSSLQKTITDFNGRIMLATTFTF